MRPSAWSTASVFVATIDAPGASAAPPATANAQPTCATQPARSWSSRAASRPGSSAPGPVRMNSHWTRASNAANWLWSTATSSSVSRAYATRSAGRAEQRVTTTSRRPHDDFTATRSPRVRPACRADDGFASLLLRGEQHVTRETAQGQRPVVDRPQATLGRREPIVELLTVRTLPVRPRQSRRVLVAAESVGDLLSHAITRVHGIEGQSPVEPQPE